MIATEKVRLHVVAPDLSVAVEVLDSHLGDAARKQL